MLYKNTVSGGNRKSECNFTVMIPNTGSGLGFGGHGMHYASNRKGKQIAIYRNWANILMCPDEISFTIGAMKL